MTIWTKGHQEFRLDTGWACGLVVMDAATGKVVKGGAPIFNCFVGQRLLSIVNAKGYKLEALGSADPQGSLFE